MAKKSRIARNNKILKTVEAQSEKRNGLKLKIKQIKANYFVQYEKCKTDEEKLKLRSETNKQMAEISFAFQKIKRNGSATRYRNRCALTGRPRGYMGLFGVSRVTFREMASFGLIPGLKKSSW